MKIIDFILRFTIGFIFVFSALHKLVDPCSFSVAVENYNILPNRFLINILAILLPVAELIFGVALILNTKVKGAILNLALMDIMFIFAISINLILGKEFDCGCFSPYDPDNASNPVSLLIRDIIILLVLIFMYIYRLKQNKSKTNIL